LESFGIRFTVGRKIILDVILIIEDWLLMAAVDYNTDSWKKRDNYVAHLLIPIVTLSKIIHWSLRCLPDEILVGIDPDFTIKNPKIVDEKFKPFKTDLFAGQGFLLGEPHLVNRGDAYSVNQIPEDWTDNFFHSERGIRGSRFCHYIHSHPNSAALPSQGDKEASQWTEGCEMILGLNFSPKILKNWEYEDSYIRRKLDHENNQLQKNSLSSGSHIIHGMEMIAYHRSGLGINLLITDEFGNPIGLFE
tara:strand:- start:208 stop:951 length:744 start_codon:yes stop_codon:yes gene_type:complete